MKLIIFTLDAIFALIIAVTAVSVLGYFFYYPQTTATISYSSAATALQTLSSTTVGSIAQQSALFSAIAYQANASGEVWDANQKNNLLDAGNPHGPLLPYTSFIYQASSTPSGIVADYGKIFFMVGNVLYAMNATTGIVAWQKNTQTVYQNRPIIASGMLIYSNTTNVTAVNPSTNSLIWSANALTITMSSQFLAYGNKLYVGGSLPGSGNKGVFAFYLNNGTQAWSLNLGAAAGTLAMDQGSLVAETSSNIYIIDDVGSSAGTILTVPESSPYGLSVSGANGAIAFMSSIGANAISANGIGYGGFPYSTATASTSPAIYNGSMAYQGASATMLAYSSNGIQAWSKAIPSAYGSAISGNPVILSSSLMYTAWSNGYLVAQNLSTGSIAWATGVPYAGSSLYLYALAYGRLYVRDGNYIIAYGACSSGNSASILSSAASLYSNGQAGCADALVDGVAPMQNYSIFLNGTFAPSMNLATFTGTNSYAENPSTAPLNNLQTFTISGWVYPTSYSLATQGPYIYSEGQPATTMVLNILPSGSLYGATWNQGTWNSISGLSVPLNTWSFVAFSLGIGGKTGTYSLYLNNQRITSPGQPEESSPTTYSAIGVEVGSLVGQPNDYFSGGIANLQIYNETLTQGQVAQIYQGGIQSSPLQGTGLQAWYPLAGDTNDYSGLAGHTMYPVNVLFSAGNYLPIGYSNSYQLSKATQLIPVTNSITGLSRLYNVGVISWH